jgi:hypothetical protein
MYEHRNDPSMAADNPSMIDLKLEQRKIRSAVLRAFLLCVLIFGLAHRYLPQLVGLPGDTLEQRLAFWAGSSLFLLVWVLVGVGMVSTGRRRSVEDIRGSAYAPPSPRIAVAVAFLQNTLEQTFIAVVAQLALILLLEEQALPLVAASTVLFAIGRVTFLRGYPQGAGARAFGMGLTALTSLFAFVVSVVTIVARLAS